MWSSAALLLGVRGGRGSLYSSSCCSSFTGAEKDVVPAFGWLLDSVSPRGTRSGPGSLGPDGLSALSALQTWWCGLRLRPRTRRRTLCTDSQPFSRPDRHCFQEPPPPPHPLSFPPGLRGNWALKTTSAAADTGGLVEIWVHTRTHTGREVLGKQH